MNSQSKLSDEMHPRKLAATILVLACAALGFPKNMEAAVIIDLTDFNGDVATDVTGPFTDTTSSVSGSITSNLITNTTGAAGAFLDFAGAAKGINNTAITGLESWHFEWNVDSTFLGIDWSGITGTELAGMQSDAWIGASITPGSSEVTFTSATGTFTFAGGEAGDTFDQTKIYGVSTIPTIASGTDIVIFLASTTVGDSVALGADFTWSLVPEPTTAAFLGMGLILLAGRRRR